MFSYTLPIKALKIYVSELYLRKVKVLLIIFGILLVPSIYFIVAGVFGNEELLKTGLYSVILISVILLLLLAVYVVVICKLGKFKDCLYEATYTSEEISVVNTTTKRVITSKLVDLKSEIYKSFVIVYFSQDKAKWIVPKNENTQEFLDLVLLKDKIK